LEGLGGCRARGGRQTKDCRKTVTLGFKFRLGKHFSDERGLAFYNLKIGILEYLQISGEIRYPNASVTERRQQSGKKPVLCMWGQLSTIIRGVERADQ